MNRRVLMWAGPLLVLVGGVAALAWADQPAGWVLVAGTVLLLVLGPLGRRVLGVVMALLALLLVVLALPGDLALLVSGLVGLLGSALLVWTAGWWPRRRSRYDAAAVPVAADAAPLDVWKAMDAGHDPTDH